MDQGSKADDEGDESPSDGDSGTSTLGCGWSHGGKWSIGSRGGSLDLNPGVRGDGAECVAVGGRNLDTWYLWNLGG